MKKEARLKMFFKPFKAFLLELKRGKWEDISFKRSFRHTRVQSLAARNSNSLSLASFQSKLENQNDF